MISLIPLRSKIRSVLCFLMIASVTALAINPLTASVEAFKLVLAANYSSISTPSVYVVPSGKVLILEHIAFPDYWDNRGQAKSIKLRHGGGSIGGMVWDTEISYTANFNTLFRPLKLPTNTALAAPSLGDSLFLIMFYGLLVDEADLYASVPVQLKNIYVDSNSSGESLEATLELGSTRPAAIEGSHSDDLVIWQETPLTAIRALSNERRLSFMLSGVTDPLFLRFSAHALLREDYPSYFRQIILSPLNGTVAPPFLTPLDLDPPAETAS